NGTITSSGSPVANALVSTNGDSSYTDSNGNYSLRLLGGTYTVNVSKLPEFNDNSVTGVEVIVGTTTIQDIVLTAKPVGTIQGTVKS
ncbi:MAG: carboxypeptidase-like regulatory domain-containing protein, partial [ANME-2 cluster archaeon]|nr:carboxypeptidase-like regulatory domain-containing protein [ANME-2 cluster archaeon]